MYRSDQAFGRSLERLEAPPLDLALQAAGKEACSVLCRFSAYPCVPYAGLEAWRSNPIDSERVPRFTVVVVLSVFGVL